MNQPPTGPSRKSTPWKSAILCLALAIAGSVYASRQVATIVQLSKEKTGASEAELEAIFNPLLASTSTVVGSIMAVATIAGIVNVILVMRGGRKWTLVISLIGMLFSLGVLGMIAMALLNRGGHA